MAKDEKEEREKTETGSIASKVNLNDYAGDTQDRAHAEEQAGKYRHDLDRPHEPTPPGQNAEG